MNFKQCLSFVNKISFLLGLTICAASAVAQSQVNLLSNAYNHPSGYFNYSDQFYQSGWQFNSADGSLVGSNKPESVFSQIVIANGMPNYVISHTLDPMRTFQMPRGASVDDFKNGDPLMILDYPNISSDYDSFYSFPINVPAAGTYTICGAIASNSDNAPATGYANKYKQLVFVGNTDPSLGLGNMYVSSDGNGNNTLVVENGHGEILPSAFTPAPVNGNFKAYTFSKEIQLTPEHRYLSIFCPARKMWISNLRLLGDAIWSDVETLDAGETRNAQYYDMSGRRVGEDRLLPGIYVCRRGSKAEKIIVR